MTRPRRAPPLDREARRRNIIEAIAPLLAARGANVTTRELAEAAGVAEGTLFSVFEDKRALLLAAIRERLDPGPLQEELARLEGATLEEKLLAVANAVLPRFREVYPLAVALHGLNVRGRNFAMRAPTDLRAWLGAVSGAVTDLATPHAAELRVPPKRLAVIFTTLLFASRMPHMPSEERFTPEELVGFCLHGAMQVTKDR